MVGVMEIREALKQAEELGLDLVEISPNTEPPVCKIMNFGKFKYETKRRIHEAKKKQKIVTIKEMKFKSNIGTGDFDVKLRKIKEFLSAGDKVKISLWFRGREVVHNEVGIKLFDRIIEQLKEMIKIEAEPKMEGKQISMVIGPSSSKNHITSS